MDFCTILEGGGVSGDTSRSEPWLLPGEQGIDPDVGGHYGDQWKQEDLAVVDSVVDVGPVDWPQVRRS